MSAFPRLKALAVGASLATGAAGLVALAGLPLSPLAGAPARAQGTPGLMEFRWDNNRDFRRLYFFLSDTTRMRRSDYYLILKPKDRQTAMLRLTIKLPDYWDGDIDPRQMELCLMNEGGTLSRTRCKQKIPAKIELSADGRQIDVYPETPVPDNKLIGLSMTVFNPFSIGMYQFNAFIQAPGSALVSGYVGSWLIQIDAN
jgi:hypothetical protein